MPGGKKGPPYMFKTLRLGKGEIEAFPKGVADGGIHGGLTAGGKQDYRPDKFRPLGRQHACNPVSEGMADHYRRLPFKIFNGRRRIFRQFAQSYVFQRPAASPDPSGLRSHRLESDLSKPSRQVGKILSPPPERTSPISLRPFNFWANP